MFSHRGALRFCASSATIAVTADTPGGGQQVRIIIYQHLLLERWRFFVLYVYYLHNYHSDSSRRRRRACASFSGTGRAYLSLPE